MHKSFKTTYVSKLFIMNMIVQSTTNKYTQKLFSYNTKYESFYSFDILDYSLYKCGFDVKFKSDIIVKQNHTRLLHGIKMRQSPTSNWQSDKNVIADYSIMTQLTPVLSSPDTETLWK